MKSIEKNIPLISIIVPVYKVEKYLDRCVESIVNQTYTNLEIILVDDGSPDNCPQMCDAWAEKDERIRVIHKLNGGLSDARNAGMSAATGELLGFVDSDDWIREDMYQVLYANMLENDSDIAACGVQMVWEDDSPERSLTKRGSCVMETEEAMRSVINEDFLKHPVWYKLYKTDLVGSISFPVDKYHEDVFWTYKAVGASGRVSVTDEPCYYYWQRRGSIMGDVYSVKRLDALEGKKETLAYVQEHFPLLEREMRINLWYSCMYHYQQSLMKLKSDEKAAAQKYIKELVNTLDLKKDDYRALAMVQRLWIMFGKVSFDFTCRARNALKIGV